MATHAMSLRPRSRPIVLCLARESCGAVRLAGPRGVWLAGGTLPTRYTCERTVYTKVGMMTKRLIDIDDELLAAAQQAAGQDSIKGTVTEALDRLVAQQRRSEEHLRATWTDLGKALVDLQDDEVMRQAWA